MSTQDDKVKKLNDKLEHLLQRQEQFQEEINEIRKDIQAFNFIFKSERKESDRIPESNFPANNLKSHDAQEEKPLLAEEICKKQTVPTIKQKKTALNFEKFIGENLVGKIGIVILVIGVAIGTRYAIEHEYLGPVVRIIMGYVLGLGLLGLAITLKRKYIAYSALLLSGSMAILYFITYAAFSFYSLFPSELTFVLLILFTLFTVIASLAYNQQVIAHFGLVGAYAVPFLTGEDPENIVFLLAYTSLINMGILFVSLKRYWKSLYLSAFFISWIIYLSWIADSYNSPEQFKTAFAFATLFFVLFFSSFLGYKLIQKDRFVALDVIMVLSNTFIFYAFGYFLVNKLEKGSNYLGLFTIMNALLHFLVSLIIHRNKLIDRNLFHLITGLVLTFLTIAFPVQLNGSWVTMLWAGEMVIMFLIGRTSKVKFYEIIAYCIVFITFFSVLHDWIVYYNVFSFSFSKSDYTVFFNVTFLTSVLVIACLSFIVFFNKKTESQPDKNKTGLLSWMKIVLPVLLLILSYFSFFIEISAYFKQLYLNSEIKLFSDGENPYEYALRNADILRFRKVWLINYTLLFFAIISSINVWIKNKTSVLRINQIALSLVLFICLIVGLYELSELRESYLNNLDANFEKGLFNIIIRYISILFFSLLLISSFGIHRSLENKKPVLFDFIATGSILWIISSELLNWLDIAGSENHYKLSLSILWGIYSLGLVALGIRKNKPHMRILSFSVLGVTLIKLFFYDLSHLNTLSKAVIFMIMGLILLMVSFLYYKYKSKIYNDTEK